MTSSSARPDALCRITIIFQGRSRTHGRIVADDPDAGVSRVSISPSGSGFGFAVARISNINGDGKADVLVGEPTIRIRWNSWTRSFGVRRRGTAPSFTHSRRASTGLSGTESVGASAVEDVSGDELDDVVVGARGADVKQDRRCWGTVFLFNSVSGAALWSTSMPNFAGILADAHFGSAVVAIANITGDGREDVVVGAPGGDLTPWTNTSPPWGIVQVLDGVSGQAVRSIRGFAAGSQSGSSLTLPDLDGDRFADLSIRRTVLQPAANSTPNRPC